MPRLPRLKTHKVRRLRKDADTCTCVGAPAQGVQEAPQLLMYGPRGKESKRRRPRHPRRACNRRNSAVADAARAHTRRCASLLTAKKARGGRRRCASRRQLLIYEQLNKNLTHRVSSDFAESLTSSVETFRRVADFLRGNISQSR